MEESSDFTKKWLLVGKGRKTAQILEMGDTEGVGASQQDPQGMDREDG